jgi:hypothetical protein
VTGGAIALIAQKEEIVFGIDDRGQITEVLRELALALGHWGVTFSGRNHGGFVKPSIFVTFPFYMVDQVRRGRRTQLSADWFMSFRPCLKPILNLRESYGSDSWRTDVLFGHDGDVFEILTVWHSLCLLGLHTVNPPSLTEGVQAALSAPVAKVAISARSEFFGETHTHICER